MMFKKIQKAICYFWLFAIFAPFFLCAFHPMQRGAIGGQYSQVVIAETTWTANNSTLEPLNTYLVAYWKAEDLTDSVGSHTLTNNGATFTSGKHNNAFTMNGSGQYLSIADSDDWNFTCDGTISMWVKFTALPSNGAFTALLSQVDDGNNAFKLFVYNNGGTYQVGWVAWNGGGSPSNLYANTSISVDTFYHFMWIRDGNNYTIYQDNTSIGTTSSATAFPSLSAIVYLGHEAGQSRDLNGQMDEFAIWKGYALTSGDRTALYNSTVGSFYTPDD